MKYIQNIETIIHENYSNPQFGVEMLAKLTGLSPPYLRETVYRCCQVGPQMLIENIRLEKALDLISQNNANLYDISKQAGFAYLKTFRRAIKRRLKMTPSELQTLFGQSTHSRDLLDKLRETLWQYEQQE